MSGTGNAVGLYGKLPAAGDFVTRALPSAFVAPWDDWLQRSLVASRAQLAERWIAIYLESPIWRFALQPQVCGPQAWTGMLMPSVDRAGRYFPLTLVAPIEPGSSLLLTMTAAEHWYAHLERVALSALKPDATLQTMETELARLPLVPVPSSAQAHDDWMIAQELSRWWMLPDKPFSVHIPATHALPAITEFAAVHLMEAQGRQRTIWWMRDSPGRSIALRVWQGLPPPDEYAALLSGAPGPSR